MEVALENRDLEPDDVQVDQLDDRLAGRDLGPRMLVDLDDDSRDGRGYRDTPHSPRGPPAGAPHGRGGKASRWAIAAACSRFRGAVLRLGGLTWRREYALRS